MTNIGREQSPDNRIYWVADNIIAADFPPVSTALRDPDGLLAIGGDLEPERLLVAYRRGIFPWFSEGQPILWWSPDPRCALEPDALKISRSLRRTLKRGRFRVTFNQAYSAVLQACAAPRRDQPETWITAAMIRAYQRLHDLGFGLSVECWSDGRLAGGLYGVIIGRIFFGESMFSREPDASKVALVHLARALVEREFRLVDCQIHSRHMQSMGAMPMPRRLFVNIVERYCALPARHDWPLESTLS